MNKFKIGDIITCTRTVGSLYLNIGKQYEVLGVHGDKVQLKVNNYEKFWYSFSLFELVKDHFDMQKEPWFIRVNADTYQAVQNWLLVNYGKILPFSEMPKHCMFLTNTTTTFGRVKQEVMWTTGSLHGSEKEIKLTFVTTVKSAEFPEIIDEKKIEIENIRKEMENLAERMKQLEGN